MEKNNLENWNEPWTDKERAFVKKYYKALGSKKIANLLKRTPVAIKIQAQLMGVTEPRSKGPEWTREEKRYFLNNFYRKNYRELSKALNRSTSTLHKWAQFLDLKSLTLSDRMEIKTMFDNEYTAKEIAKVMGMTEEALKLWARTAEGCTTWELEQRAKRKSDHSYV
ncbi:hypothetical protein [Dolosicoccus paucivorans]|uniref:hypothetical protein n=1 Tax=Dolosicoccus paucivorans TaxID=84521 RepID=UPI0008830CB0|nr:hypothetical protein [Dolosicoccus paucivorans]SDI40331.1 hypothetical protein SAMN04487994_10109 [Dolosicoccus paucivorans]